MWSVSAWVLSKYLGLPLQSKDVHTRLTGNSTLAVRVCASKHKCQAFSVATLLINPDFGFNLRSQSTKETGLERKLINKTVNWAGM